MSGAAWILGVSEHKVRRLSNDRVLPVKHRTDDGHRYYSVDMMFLYRSRFEASEGWSSPGASGGAGDLHSISASSSSSFPPPSLAGSEMPPAMRDSQTEGRQAAEIYALSDQDYDCRQIVMMTAIPASDVERHVADFHALGGQVLVKAESFDNVNVGLSERGIEGIDRADALRGYRPLMAYGDEWRHTASLMRSELDSLRAAVLELEHALSSMASKSARSEGEAARLAALVRALGGDPAAKDPRGEP